MIRFFAATLCVALGLMLRNAGIDAWYDRFSQDNPAKSSPVVSQVTYNKVLDVLFSWADSDPNKTVFTIVLRFKPSFHTESQIVLRRRLDKVEVRDYVSLDGSIYGKLNEVLMRTGNEDAVEMAKLIQVKRRTMEIPYSQVKQWHMSFLANINDLHKAFKRSSEEYDKAGTVALRLDGTFYDLWYEQGLNKMSFSLYDEEIDALRSTGDFKLVQWMNGVRREVSKLK
jgi:hypothetical protein